MKTKFTNTEISLIKRWAKDAGITPNYITIYHYPKQGSFAYRMMISDQQKYSTMDFLNPEYELFDTISLTHQLSKVFEQPVKISIQ